MTLPVASVPTRNLWGGTTPHTNHLSPSSLCVYCSQLSGHKLTVNEVDAVVRKHVVEGGILFRTSEASPRRHWTDFRGGLQLGHSTV